MDIEMNGASDSASSPDSLRPGVFAADFKAAGWIRNAHLQTIWAPLFRKSVALPLRRERWELPDGDFLDVDRLSGNPGAPTLLVLHGLEGSSETPYARGLLAQAQHRGFSATALNFRSCSGETNRLLRSYHSGETGDIGFAVEKLRQENPGGPIVIAGVSLGGNALVKWLGEQEDRLPAELRGAVAISVPFDLAACAGAIDGKGFWARIYRERFLRTLLPKARAKAARFPDGPRAIDPKRLEGIRTLVDFDDRVTGPVHGFSGAADYYAKSSSNQFVARVRTKLLLLSAEDDPFIPREVIPSAAVAASATRDDASVRLEISRRGGHVGFVEGPPFGQSYWAEQRAGKFFDDLFPRAAV